MSPGDRKESAIPDPIAQANLKALPALYWRVRATTIRFPNDLWEQLEREARKQGISVAQYVRDAALYRVAFSAGAASGSGSQEERTWRPPSVRPPHE
jgi:hypothetical protein